MTVRAPWPISTLPSSTSMLPSGRIFTTTWLGSPPPLMPVEYQTAAMPFPRFLTMGASVRALPGCHLQQVGVQPETCPFGRRLHDPDQTAVVLNRPGGGGVAVPDSVEEAQPPGVDPNSLGDALHLHVPGKRRLVQPKSPHRGGRAFVGEYRVAVDPHVGDVVRPGDAVAGLAHHVVVGGGVGPAIAHHLDLAGQQPAVFGHAVLEPEMGGGPMGGGYELLFPGPDPLHRPPSRVKREHRADVVGMGVVLGAEAAPQDAADHMDGGLRLSEDG